MFSLITLDLKNIQFNLETKMNDATIKELIREDGRRRRETLVEADNKLNHIS